MTSNFFAAEPHIFWPGFLFYAGMNFSFFPELIEIISVWYRATGHFQALGVVTHLVRR